MKKITLALLFTFAIGISSNVKAQETFGISAAQLQNITQILPLDLINWKVGDTMEFQLSHAMFGKMGTSVKTADHEEGAALWIKQTITAMGQNQVVEILINRADAKILKYRQNGKDQPIPDQAMEIISQEYTDVTVPAGTFKALHITAKTKDVSKLEIWANPQATCMDGGVKTIMATQMGEMTLELTKFKRN